MSLAATEALKYNIDISNLAKSCDRMAEVLKKHKINSNEYVSEETSKVANQVVEKLNNVTIINNHTTINNYTTINNVSEKNKFWTFDRVVALASLIISIIMGIHDIACDYQNDHQKTAEQIIQSEQFTDLVSCTNELSNQLDEESNQLSCNSIKQNMNK